jgi:hypothetical protein
LRTLATGWVPTFGGGGKPQRIIVSTRSPSAARTTGAIWSGKIPGSGGRLPVSSRSTAKVRRIPSQPQLFLPLPGQPYTTSNYARA